MQLEAADPKSPEFDTKLGEFIAAVAHHVEEEESTILPELSESVGQERLKELGKAFAERRSEELEAFGISDSGDESGDMSRDQLYRKAREADIPGRSQMTKDELFRAVRESKR